jgi:hypothetical protein
MRNFRKDHNIKKEKVCDDYLQDNYNLQNSIAYDLHNQIVRDNI